MDDDGTWAPGLAHLPGIDYVAPPGTRPPRLSPNHATPRVSHHEFDGQSRCWLSWETREGSTSASPAQRHGATRPEAMDSASEILAHLHAGLALPGTPNDYHFAIQHAIDELWKRRKTDAAAILPIEGLCLLDIAIVEAYPTPFRSGDRFVSMTSTRLLVSLYEHAGDLEAAIELARRVDPFLNGMGEIERLEAKRDRVEQEESL